jgi:hypothetical protein
VKCFMTHGTIIHSVDGNRGTLTIIHEVVLFNSTQVFCLLQKPWFESSLPSS